VHWNYRVVRRGDQLAIHEAYYNGQEVPHSITKTPVSPSADNVEELGHLLKLMMEALERPILEYDSYTFD
jgi:hypothetical protein